MTDDRQSRGRQVADFIERIGTAAVVGLVTYLVATRLLHSTPEGSKDPAVLNAALAYYTHQVSGGLASMVSGVMGFASYHLIERWQDDHRSK